MWLNLKSNVNSLLNASIESKAFMVTPFYSSILETMNGIENEQELRRDSNALQNNQ